MATINVSESTKTRFKKLKLQESVKKGYSIPEDEFIDTLLNYVDEGKEKRRGKRK